MEYVVLGLLMIQNLTLYKLNQAFKQGISMFYSASYGSLQAAVKGLLNKEWIIFTERVENGRNQKVYNIMPDGREAFVQWMLDEIPPSKLEVTALAKVYFLGLLPSVEQKRMVVQEILDKIEQGQNELEQIDAALSQAAVPEVYRPILKYQVKTLDYGLQSHRQAKEWFQTLLEELDAE